MSGIDRRAVLGGIAAGSLLAAPLTSCAARNARIVIVGGGFGGATAAMSLAGLMPGADITLIEPKQTYMACPLSNLVIAGMRPLSKQAHNYDGVRAAGVTVIHQAATDIDPVKKQVTLADGKTLAYDKLICAPGISMRWNALEGYDQAAAQMLPHAWQAGPQTTLLQQQIAAMDDGGVIVMSIPAAPYRCPPGPYERASLIAHYLKTHKPKSKLILLDAKDKFSKQPLFTKQWAERYDGIIEWRGRSDDGGVIRVDAAAKTLHTDFESLKADVINVIPPQRAGDIARKAGLTDSSLWCPVDPLTFASKLQKNIYVIGDAAIATPMPKSAFSAAMQAKMCAVQIAREFRGLPPLTTVLTNTCYSLVAPDAAVSISGVYRTGPDMLQQVKGAGGLTAMSAGADVLSLEADQAQAWYDRATAEAFG